MRACLERILPKSFGMEVVSKSLLLPVMLYKALSFEAAIPDYMDKTQLEGEGRVDCIIYRTEAVYKLSESAEIRGPMLNLHLSQDEVDFWCDNKDDEHSYRERELPARK